MISILKQERQEGFAAGWDACRLAMSERVDNAYDLGFSSGRCAARDEQPSRFRWFCIGAVMMGLSFIFPVPFV